MRGCAPLGGQDVGRGDEHADRSAERKGGDLLARLVDLDAQPIFYEDLNARHGAEEGLVGDDASAVATWSIAERECSGRTSTSTGTPGSWCLPRAWPRADRAPALPRSR